MAWKYFVGGKNTNDHVLLKNRDDVVADDTADDTCSQEDGTVEARPFMRVSHRFMLVGTFVSTAVLCLILAPGNSNATVPESVFAADGRKHSKLTMLSSVAEDVASNRFCVEFMQKAACGWTKDYSCVGEPRGKFGLAENDQSVGFHCCCQLGYWKSTPAQNKEAKRIFSLKTAILAKDPTDAKAEAEAVKEIQVAAKAKAAAEAQAKAAAEAQAAKEAKAEKTLKLEAKALAEAKARATVADKAEKKKKVADKNHAERQIERNEAAALLKKEKKRDKAAADTSKTIEKRDAGEAESGAASAEHLEEEPNSKENAHLEEPLDPKKTIHRKAAKQKEQANN